MLRMKMIHLPTRLRERIDTIMSITSTLENVVCDDDMYMCVVRKCDVLEL